MLPPTPETKEPRMSDPQRDLQDELRHIRDLVFVRDLLREHGADSGELRACDVVVDEARAKLAELAKRASAVYAAAA
jgi:hypothetical protein